MLMDVLLSFDLRQILFQGSNSVHLEQRSQQGVPNLECSLKSWVLDLAFLSLTLLRQKSLEHSMLVFQATA